MEELLVELAEPATVFVYALIAAGLAVLGVLAELAGLAGASGGLDPKTLWFLFVGLVAFAAALTIVREQLYPALADRSERESAD